jgi:hypothetical protein
LCNTCRIPAMLNTRLISLCCNQTPKNWKLGISPFLVFDDNTRICNIEQEQVLPLDMCEV